MAGSSTTPSSMASAMARMPASGLRRSCDTQAISSRRADSWSRSRRRDSSRRWAIEASSSRRRVSSKGADRRAEGDGSPVAPPRSAPRLASGVAPSPMRWASSPSSRLPGRDPVAQLEGRATPTDPAATSTTARASRSCSDRNIAQLAAAAPIAVAPTATRDTTTAWRPTGASPIRWRMAKPASAATSAAPDARATRPRASATVPPSRTQTPNATPAHGQREQDPPHGSKR